jgi:hypothetical protein
MTLTGIPCSRAAFRNPYEFGVRKTLLPQLIITNQLAEPPEGQVLAASAGLTGSNIDIFNL